jgi:hypothetical protein
LFGDFDTHAEKEILTLQENALSYVENQADAMAKCRAIWNTSSCPKLKQALKDIRTYLSDHTSEFCE